MIPVTPRPATNVVTLAPIHAKAQRIDAETMKNETRRSMMLSSKGSLFMGLFEERAFSQRLANRERTTPNTIISSGYKTWFSRSTPIVSWTRSSHCFAEASALFTDARYNALQGSASCQLAAPSENANPAITYPLAAGHR